MGRGGGGKILIILKNSQVNPRFLSDENIPRFLLDLTVVPVHTHTVTEINPLMHNVANSHHTAVILMNGKIIFFEHQF